MTEDTPTARGIGHSDARGGQRLAPSAPLVETSPAPDAAAKLAE